MSEESAVVEAVPDTTQSVAVDPALLNKPVMPTQSSPGSAEDEGLKLKLGLANKHTKEAERKANPNTPVSYTHLTLPTKRIV